MYSIVLYVIVSYTVALLLVLYQYCTGIIYKISITLALNSTIPRDGCVMGQPTFIPLTGNCGVVALCGAKIYKRKRKIRAKDRERSGCHPGFTLARDPRAFDPTRDIRDTRRESLFWSGWSLLLLWATYYTILQLVLAILYICYSLYSYIMYCTIYWNHVLLILIYWYMFYLVLVRDSNSAFPPV